MSSNWSCGLGRMGAPSSPRRVEAVDRSRDPLCHQAFCRRRRRTGRPWARRGDTRPRRTPVKDAQGNLVQGRTRWRRFAAVMAPAAVAAGAIVFGMANGAIAASFAVSGTSFKVSATELDGTGFVQYGGLAHANVKDANGMQDH